MISLDNCVANFPARVVSKMTSHGTSFDSTVFRLDKHAGGGQEVFFRGYRLSFEVGDSDKEVIARVNKGGFVHRIDTDKLQVLLREPERFSAASINQKEKYLSAFSKGEYRQDLSGDKQTAVSYKLKKRKGISEDEIFESFWYVLKPVLNSIV